MTGHSSGGVAAQTTDNMPDSNQNEGAKLLAVIQIIIFSYFHRLLLSCYICCFPITMRQAKR